MWVRLQDGVSLVKCSSAQVVEGCEAVEITGVDITGRLWVLGYYGTLSRALGVLSELQTYIGLGRDLYQMPKE